MPFQRLSSSVRDHRRGDRATFSSLGAQAAWNENSSEMFYCRIRLTPRG
jgi:hypothetical protein